MDEELKRMCAQIEGARDDDQEFWLGARQSYLLLIDHIEREKLHMSPTTAEIRQAYKAARMRATGVCEE